MFGLRTPALTLGAAIMLAGCGGEGTPDDEARDLSLAPAESIAALDDRPQPGPQPQQSTPRQTAPAQQRPPSQTAPTQPRAATPTAQRTVPAGAIMELTARDTISSKTNKAGDAVWATSSADVVDERGRVLIPAGATFQGVIDVIKEAENPGDRGTLVLAFNRVSYGGKTYSLEGRSDSLATQTQGRGVAAGDVAKVGAGAAAGAVVGGIISKKTGGAVVGGIVGAAAGTGIAAATKDSDIVLPAGGRIRIVLARQMVLEPVS